MEVLNVLAEILPVIVLGLIIWWVGKNNPVEPDDRIILPPEDWDCDWYEIWEEEEKAEKKRKEMMTVITREELEEFLEAMWEERLKK